MKYKFPKLFELSNFYLGDERSYFHNFWDKFEEEPERVDAFTLVEGELQALDHESWTILRDEAKELCIKSQGGRGWSQLFEKLNEAKGYCFLKNLGCSNVRFIQRAKKKGVETPDLEGTLCGAEVLCEVKTINISDDLIRARRDTTPITRQHTMTPELAKKLTAVISKANSQLNEYATKPLTKRYAYIVIEFDDSVDYRKELNKEARGLFATFKFNQTVLVIHNDDHIV